jgi:hypothetical protein
LSAREARSGKAGSLPAARIAHACPSRTRLSFPDLKGKADPLKDLCDAAVKLAGVKQVEARPRTGSLIVTHDGSTEGLVASAELAGLFYLEEAAEEYAPSFEARAWKTSIDGFLEETFGKGIDLSAVAAFTFFAIALRQLAAGQVMPPAATAFWYGLSILFARGMGMPPAADPGDGDGGE